MRRTIRITRFAMTADSKYPYDEEDENRPETSKPVATASPPAAVPSFDDARKLYESAESSGFAQSPSEADDEPSEQDPQPMRLPERPKDVDPFDFSSPRTQEQAAAATSFLQSAGVYGDAKATERLREAYASEEQQMEKAAQRKAKSDQKAAATAHKASVGLAMDVMAQQGIEFEVSPGGQKRAKRHSDGQYVFRADWVGEPRFDAEKGTYLRDFRDERGEVQSRDLWAEKVLRTDTEEGSPSFGKVYLPLSDGRKQIVGENGHFLRVRELRKQLESEREDQRLASSEREMLRNRLTDELGAPWREAQARIAAARKPVESMEKEAELAPDLRKDPSWAQRYKSAKQTVKRLEEETRPVRQQYEGVRKRIADLNAAREASQRRIMDLTVQRRNLEAEPTRPEFHAAAAPVNESAAAKADRERTGVGGDSWQIPDIELERQALVDRIKELDQEGRGITSSVDGIRMTVGGLRSKITPEQEARIAEIKEEKRRLIDRFTSRTSAITKFATNDTELARRGDAIAERSRKVLALAESRIANIRVAASQGRLAPKRAEEVARKSVEGLEPEVLKNAAALDRIEKQRMDNRRALFEELSQDEDIPSSLISTIPGGKSLDPDAFQRRVVGRAAAIGERESDAFLEVAEEIRKRGDITHIGTEPLATVIRNARTVKGASLGSILDPEDATAVMLGLRGSAATHLPALLNVRYEDVIEARKVEGGGTALFQSLRPTLAPVGAEFLPNQILADPVGPVRTAVEFFQRNIQGAAEKGERSKAYQDAASFAVRLAGRISRLPEGDEQRAAMEKELAAVRANVGSDPEFQTAYKAATTRRNAAGVLARMDSAYMDERRNVLGSWTQSTSAGVENLRELREKYEPKREAMLRRFSDGERREIEEATRTERVLNALDSVGSEKLDAYDKINDIIDRPSQLVPFLATAVEIPAIVEVAKSAQRLEQGKATADDMEILARFTAKDSQERTLWYNVLDVVSMLPAFAGELASTAGLYSGGKAVATAGAKAALQKLIGESAVEWFTHFAAKEAAGKTVFALSERLAAKGAASLVGSAAQAPVAGGVRIIEGAIRRAMPQVDGLSEDENGDLEFILRPGDSAFTAALKAAGDQYVETFSEHSGKAFDILGQIGGKALPKVVREPLAKAFLFGKWLEKTPGAKPSAFRKLLNDAGWNGVIQEMGEERVGDIARAFGEFVTSVAEGEDIGAAAGEAAAGAVPSWEQLATEAIAFSIPGAGISLTSAAMNRNRKAPLGDARAQAFDVLDQSYRDLSDAVRSPEALAAFNAKNEAEGRRPVTLEAARDILRETSEARSTLAIESLVMDESAFADRLRSADSGIDTAKAISDVRASGDRLGAIVAVGDHLRNDGVVIAGEVRSSVDAMQANLAAGQVGISGVESILRGGTIPTNTGMALEELGLLVRAPLGDGRTEYRVSLEGLSLLPPAIREEVRNSKGGQFKIAPVGVSGDIARTLSKEGNRMIGAALRPSSQQTGPPSEPGIPTAAPSPSPSASTSEELTRESLAGKTADELRAIAGAHDIDVSTATGEPPLTGAEIASRILDSVSSRQSETNGEAGTETILAGEANLEGADDSRLSATTGASASSTKSPYRERPTHRVVLESKKGPDGMMDRKTVEIHAKLSEDPGQVAEEAAGDGWNAVGYWELDESGETVVPTRNAEARTDSVASSVDVGNSPDVPREIRDVVDNVLRELNTRHRKGKAAVTARIVTPSFASHSANKKSTVGAGRFASEFEDAFGKSVLFLKFSALGMPMAGVSRSNPDVLFVNVDAPAPLQMLVGHEFAHMLEMDRPDIYEPLERALLDMVRNRKTYAQKLRRQGYSLDRLNSEIVGNIIGDQFDSPEFWRELASRDAGTFRRVARAAIEFLQRMMDRFRSFTWGTSEMLSDVKEARAVIADALSKYAAERQTSENGETKSGAAVEFALPPVPKNLDGIIDGPLNRAVVGSVRAAGQLAKGVAESDAIRPIVQRLAGLMPEKFAPVAAAAIKTMKRQILPNGALPAEAAAMIRESLVADAYGRTLGAEWAKLLTSGSQSQMLGLQIPKRLVTAENRRLLNDVLLGERELGDLPEELRPVAQRVRTTIDRLGQRAVDAGLLSPETFERGKGTYLPRLYRSKELMERGLFGAGWKAMRMLLDRTGSARLSDAYAIVRGTRPVNHSPGKFRFDSAYERDSYYDQLQKREVLRWLREQGGVPRGLTESDIASPDRLPADLQSRIRRLKSKFASLYAKSDPLSDETLDRMGLIREPGYPVAKAIIQLNHDIVMSGLFRQIAAKSEWVSDVDSPDFVQMPDNPRWGDLAGKYVNEDIAAQLQQIADAPGEAMQIYDEALRVWKKWKTVYNPATHGRNVIGNVLFADLAGVNPMNPLNAKYYAEMVQTLRGKGSRVSLDELYREGVLGADITAVELQNALEGVEITPETLAGKIFDLLTAKAVRQFAQRAYQFEDEMFKVAAYLKARDAGMTPKEATAHVRKWFPFYDQLPRSATMAGAKRVFPFLSFFYEATRIGAVAVAEKPFTLAKWMAIPSLITLYSLARLGIDDDDREAVLSQMRGKIFGWPVFSALMPFEDSQGRPVQFDLTNIVPYAQPLGLRLDRSDEKNPLWQDVLLTLLTSNPLTNLSIGLAFNQDAFTGRELRVAGMTGLEQAEAVGAFVGKTVLPPLTPGVGTTWNTITAPERSKGTLQKRDQGQALARALVGVDLRSAAPSLFRAIESFQRENAYTERPERFGETAVSRSKGRLYEALINENTEVMARELRYLEGEGIRFINPDEIRKWVMSRHPIKGSGRIKADDVDRFLGGLSPMEREEAGRAVVEFNRVLSTAPTLLAQAREEMLSSR